MGARGSGDLPRTILLSLLFAAPCTAQEPRKGKAYEPPEPPVLRWEVTLGGAGGFGVSTSDMDEAVRAAGYQSSSSGDFLSATFFPSVRFRLGEYAAVGTSFSSTKLGSTTASSPATSISIQRSSEDVALAVFFRPFSGVRVGAGPAWYRLTATPSAGEEFAVSKLGWIAEAGVAFPETGRFYADFGVQYRGAGRADFGTVRPSGPAGASPAPIPLNGIRCDHWAFLAGIGVRF